MEKPQPSKGKQKALIAMNTALSIALVTAGMRNGDPIKTRAGVMKACMQATRMAKLSEKFSFLRKINTENLSFGMAFASISMRAPQLWRVLQTGNPFARSMAAMICAAFIMQAVRPVDTAVKAGCRRFWAWAEKFTPFKEEKAIDIQKRFIRAADRIDDVIYKNTLASSLLTEGPKVFMGLNAAGTMAQGYLAKDWHAVATGATYLAGIIIFHKAERAWLGGNEPIRMQILELKDYPPIPAPEPAPQAPTPV